MSTVVIKCTQTAPSGHDTVYKGKCSTMENADGLRQGFDTGSEPGDPGIWRYTAKMMGRIGVNVES